MPGKLNALPPSRWRTLLRRTAADCGGLALIEFALAFPLVMTIGGYGIELCNLSIVNLRVSQYALDLADDASRVGSDASAGVTDLREVDINDVLQGARLQGAGINLTTYGRVTLSSLEYVQQSYDSAPVQRIHWQRCIGLKSGAGYDSSYGAVDAAAGSDATQANAGVTAASGMGDAGSQVNAPQGGGAMFVEVNYDYQPLFGSLFVSARKIHYVASYVVRDNRDYSQIFNPSPAATPSSCDKHST